MSYAARRLVMLNAIDLPLSEVDEFFKRLWTTPLAIRFEIDDAGNYTVFNVDTNSVIQQGWIAPGGTPEAVRRAISQNVRDGMPTISLQGAALERYAELLKRPEVVLSTVITPAKKTHEGLLVASTSIAWAAIVERVGRDWSKATELTSDQWEELIAGAYKKANYDEVILTPHSADRGRDVIAIRKGVGSIKIIGSVKAYKPGLIVGYDYIRALIGVMAGEGERFQDVITTHPGLFATEKEEAFIHLLIAHRAW